MVSEKSGTTSACKAHAPGAVMLIIFSTINMSMQAVILFLGLKIIVGLVRGGQTLKNATGSTLIFAILGTIAMILWTLQYAASYAAPATHTMRSINMVSFDVGIPAAAVLVATACMNLSLMWIQVAQSAKSLKRSGSNLGRKPQIVVAVVAITFGLVEIVCFAIINRNDIGAAISLLFFLGMGGTFIVGSRRLAFAIGGAAADNSVPSMPGSARSSRPKKSTNQSSPRLRGIVKLGRRIGINVFIYCIFAIMYTAVRMTRSWGYGTNDKPAPFPAWPAVEQICVFGLIFSVNVILAHLMGYVKDVTAVKRGVTTTMPEVSELKSETCFIYRSDYQRWLLKRESLSFEARAPKLTQCLPHLCCCSFSSSNSFGVLIISARGHSLHSVGRPVRDPRALVVPPTGAQLPLLREGKSPRPTAGRQGEPPAVAHRISFIPN